METLTTTQVFWLALALVWSAAWKYWAFWRSARNNDKGWFIAFCLLNTLGILEILYLFIWGKPKYEEK